MTPERLAIMRMVHAGERHGLVDGIGECIDAIEALRAENERLTKALNGWNDAAVLCCDHCGDIAALSWSKTFWDGEQGHCASCGIAGQIHADGNNCYWAPADDDDELCAREECGDCYPALAGKAGV